MTTKNDEAWEALFHENQTLVDIKKDGFVHITADTMKGYREPRLMAKLDTLEVLPEVFSENRLSILPIRNGEYVIFEDPDFHSYFRFPKNFENIKPKNYQPSKPLSDFDSFSNLEYMNEAKALDIAFMSSIIKNFTNENEIWLTIRGRQYTSGFQIVVPNLIEPIQISSVQIEIDAGYETDNAIYVFEAKIGKRENFNIRQLLFPYLEWKNRTKKQVIPIFFYYTNDLYYLFQFELGNSLDVSHIVKQACYKFDEPYRFNLEEVLSTPARIRENETEIPFPQANDFNKVIDIVTLVNQGYDTKMALSESMEFDERQGDYYANAARFIGLLDRNNDTFLLTEPGKEFLQISSPIKRAEFVLKQLAMRPVFHQVFNYLLLNNLEIDSLDLQTVSKIIRKHTTLQGSTSNRRASTVIQWIKWIFNYVE